MTALMIQGCGSDAGKSTLVCALARAYRRRGLRVAPFKPQNMSNNAAVTVDGGEIGRAQALQARACGLEATTDMNPVLLKPEAETGAQIVVGGQARTRLGARAYRDYAPTLMPDVLAAFNRLKADADLVLVEGAGSPAEVNLRTGDIANMGFSCAADCPVVLAVDIERGGAIAALVGTRAVLAESDAAQIKGFIVNRFRGDMSLFDDGRNRIQAHTGWEDCGVMPWIRQAARLPLEDSANLEFHMSGSALKRGGAAISGRRLQIAVIRYPRIANTDDLDPFLAESDLDVRLIAPDSPLPVDTDLVLLPGSKAVISDLRNLKSHGMDSDIIAHVRRGGAVVGLCGGYQMMGHVIHDPAGLEGPKSDSELGLGLLNVETILEPRKVLQRVSGRSFAQHTPFEAYEIHLGRTTQREAQSLEAFSQTHLVGRGDASALTTWLEIRDPKFCDGERWHARGVRQGGCFGSYLHGAFASDAFRAEFLREIDPAYLQKAAFEQGVEAALDALADAAEAHLDLDRLLQIAR